MHNTTCVALFLNLVKSVFIFSPQVYQYRRGGKHPAQPNRLRRTFELLDAYGALDSMTRRVIAPREATKDELAAFHTRKYIRAVRALSDAAYENRLADHIIPEQFGFRTGGNPIFARMYHAGAVRVGGGLQAAELLLRGDAEAVFHPAGGGHHGQPARTSGFCIFNDVVIAIKKFLEHGLRVVYVDVDAHHGDGVQDAFYDDARVLTISLHETGETLFPGTGDVDEIGVGEGRGYCLNVPFLRETDDEIYLRAFLELVPPAIQNFAPDVLVTEIGADAHFLDPLAHLKLTTCAFEEMTRAFRALSPGKWLCVGGGGYREAVVPRVWALVWGEMNGVSHADELPEIYRAGYPDSECLRDGISPQVDLELRARARTCRRMCEIFARGNCVREMI